MTPSVLRSFHAIMLHLYLYNHNEYPGGGLTHPRPRQDEMNRLATASRDTFDTENRLTSVTVNGQVTSFHYDAGGNRTLIVQPNGTKVYTPFPDYEETVPASGGATKRVTFSLAGQLIAVRVITDTTNNYYYAYADHLANVGAWTNASGASVSGSLARYEPYGGYRTKPPASVNPGISDCGFTGHRMNNNGGYDMGLIYMTNG